VLKSDILQQSYIHTHIYWSLDWRLHTHCFGFYRNLFLLKPRYIYIIYIYSLIWIVSSEIQQPNGFLSHVFFF
jgi:hypothetical protein